MKKIILSLGIVVFAFATFFKINSTNNNSDVNLAHLIAINSAQGESDSNGCDNDLNDKCLIYDEYITDCDPSWWFHHCKE